jgi:hypothetical protein
MAFTDLFEYEHLLLPVLYNLVNNPPNNLGINTKHILNHNGIDKSIFKTKDQKKMMDIMRVALCCTYVLLYESRQYHNTGNVVMEVSEQQQQTFLNECMVDQRFRSAFDANTSADRRDILYMMEYCKYLKLALELLPKSRNKGLAMQIASRLDGSNEIYVLGSGQKDSATRREVIYHMQSGIPFPTKRESDDDDESMEENESGQRNTSSSNKPAIPRVSSNSSKRSRESSEPDDPMGDTLSIDSNEKKSKLESASTSKFMNLVKPGLSRDHSLWLGESGVSSLGPQDTDTAPAPNTTDDLEHETLLSECHFGFTETAQSIHF